MNKALLLVLCLLCVRVNGQGICFTRAELEAAADSALKGMAAVEGMIDLRKAAQRHARAIIGYQKTVAVQDSIIHAAALKIAALETKLYDSTKESNQRGETIVKLKDENKTLQRKNRGAFWRGFGVGTAFGLPAGGYVNESLGR